MIHQHEEELRQVSALTYHEDSGTLSVKKPVPGTSFTNYEHNYPLSFAEDNFDEEFVRGVVMHPGVWFPIPLGDANESEAPKELKTNVQVRYQQGKKNYCLTYSMASALYYCGKKKESGLFSEYAELIRKQPKYSQLQIFFDKMKEIVPSIGTFKKYNIRNSKNKKNKLSIEQLCGDKSPYPVLVLPECKDGSHSHAFCVVDDLIFDSTQTHALKLEKESIDWICSVNEGFERISEAYLFFGKFKTQSTWKREMKTNW